MCVSLQTILAHSKTKPGFVYLIHDSNNNTYKIGRTNNLKKRLQNLGTGNPHLHMVDHVIWNDVNYLEKYLHKRLDMYREKKSEYFNLPKEQVEWVHSLFISLYQEYRKSM